MDQEQRELRRAAAQAFIESLDKLQETLCAPAEDAKAADTVLDCQFMSFEDALEDIEQFIDSKQDELPEA